MQIKVKNLSHFIVFWLVVILPSYNLYSKENTVLETKNIPISLSTKDIINRVKSHNLQLLFQKDSVRRALEESIQLRSYLLPNLSLGAQQGRLKYARGIFSEAVNDPPFSSFSTRVEASLPIVDTKRYANYRISKMNYDIAQNDYASLTQDFLDQAMYLYFTHLRDLRSVELAIENLEREQMLLELAKQRFEAGASVKIDVTRTEIRIAKARRTLIQADTQAKSSVLNLKLILDIKLDKKLILDRSIIENITDPSSIKRSISVEDLAGRRPELSSQQLKLEQAKLAKTASSWQRLPTLDLFANWGYDSSQAFDGEEGEAWSLGIRADIPIWEGGRIDSEKREAAAVLRQNEYLMSDLIKRIEHEFELSIIKMDSQYAQIELSENEVRLGSDEVELALKRYKAGMADNRELIEAQNRLSGAEKGHLDALYLYYLSRLAFAKSIGSIEKVLD